ncbi:MULTISPECIES: hypothetical protein [Streptomyces]|uniref:hypothetical protein n=1 Tax=Streptomyces TaxID=1883 RepID=UPI0029BD1889|nr:hypothetical protein [Streptomyces sp. ME02-6979.5a]MDX3336901.1 hypothetical protein [Streptomyces sp. ME02-6979.5a]
MAVRRCVCWVAVCDICGTTTDPDEYTPHFDTPDQAITNATHRGDPTTGWTLTPDGRLICTENDPAHHAVTEHLPGPDAMTITYA